MPKWMQRIRGAIGMGFTWAAAWGIAGMVPRWVFGFNTDAPFPLIFGVFGFAAGLLFSAILMLTEGRRTFDQMSLPRFATWGAAGGLLVSAVFARAVSFSGADTLMIAPIFALASAISASGSLALARRGAARELRDGSGDLAAQLTNPEKRKLL
jgi:hypothetical protein